MITKKFAEEMQNAMSSLQAGTSAELPLTQLKQELGEIIRGMGRFSTQMQGLEREVSRTIKQASKSAGRDSEIVAKTIRSELQPLIRKAVNEATKASSEQLSRQLSKEFVRNLRQELGQPTPKGGRSLAASALPSSIEGMSQRDLKKLSDAMAQAVGRAMRITARTADPSTITPTEYIRTANALANRLTAPLNAAIGKITQQMSDRASAREYAIQRQFERAIATAASSQASRMSSWQGRPASVQPYAGGGGTRTIGEGFRELADSDFVRQLPARGDSFTAARREALSRKSTMRALVYDLETTGTSSVNNAVSQMYQKAYQQKDLAHVPRMPSAYKNTSVVEFAGRLVEVDPRTMQVLNAGDPHPFTGKPIAPPISYRSLARPFPGRVSDDDIRSSITAMQEAKEAREKDLRSRGRIGDPNDPYQARLGAKPHPLLEFLGTKFSADELINAPGIDWKRVQRMFRAAQITGGHNVTGFDAPILRNLHGIEESISRGVFDTQVDVPWRSVLGLPGKLQELASIHGIDPGSAHRGMSDVDTLISLMQRQHPLAQSAYGKQSPNYMAMLARAHGPGVSASEKLRDWFEQQATEQIEDLDRRLRGSGSMTETSEREILGMQAQRSIAREFHRNVLTAPDVHEFTALFTDLNERRLSDVGFMRGPVGNAEDALFDAMSRVNRLLKPGSDSMHQRFGGYGRVMSTQEAAAGAAYDPMMRSMIEQVRRNKSMIRSFSDSDINTFLRQNIGKVMGRSSIETAVEMLPSVPASSSQAQSLLRLISSSQAMNRSSRLLSGSSILSGADVDEETIRKRLNERQSTRESRYNVSARRRRTQGGFATGDFLGAGLFSSLGSFFGKAWDRLTNQSEPGMSGPAQADIRAQARAERLQYNLDKLDKAVGRTADSFVKLNYVTTPDKLSSALGKRGAELQALSYRREGLLDTDEAYRSRYALTRQKIGSDYRRAIDRASSVYGQGQVSTITGDMLAQMGLDVSQQNLENVRGRLRGKGKTATEIDRATYGLQTQFRAAQIRATIREYSRKSYGLEEGETLLRLQAGTAAKISGLRHGLSERGMATHEAALINGQIPAEAPQSLLDAQELMQAFEGSMTPAQKRALSEARAVEQRKAANARLRAQSELQRKRIGVGLTRVSDQEEAIYGRYADRVRKIYDDSQAKGQRLEQRAADLQMQRAYKQRQAELDEQARGAGSGGGRSGGGGGQRGQGFGKFGNIQGFDAYGLYMGANMLQEYTGEVWNFVKAATEYAAKTDMMRLATEQMATVNGYNTKQVMGEVDAIKKLDISTQDAHSTVQKMMFVGLDIAKAPQLARVAQDVAGMSGINPSEALERILRGVTTGYTLSLHRMGIPVSGMEVRRRLIAERRSRGEHGEPSELDKREALLEETLRSGLRAAGTFEKKAMLSPGMQAALLRKELLETKNVIGEQFLPEYARLVRMLKTGATTVQNNGEGFAKLGAGIASIGLSASTLGTVALMTRLLAPIGPAGWAAGGALALGTYGLMGGFTSRTSMIKNDALSKLEQVNDKSASLDVELEALRTRYKPGTTAWVNATRDLTTSKQRLSESRDFIRQDAIRQLAEQYSTEERRWKSRSGLSRFWHAAASILPGNEIGSPEIPELGISRKDVLEKYREIMRGTDLPTTFQTEEERRARRIASQVQMARDRLAQGEERWSPGTGEALRKLERAFRGPRERTTAERDYEIARMKDLASEWVKASEQAKGTGPEAASARRVLENLRKNFGLGSDELQKLQEHSGDIIGEISARYSIPLQEIETQTRKNIMAAGDKTRLMREQTRVTPTSFDEEVAIENRLFEIGKKNLAQRRALMDVDEARVEAAQLEEHHAQALLQIDAKRREHVERMTQQRALFSSEDRSEAAGGARDITGEESIRRVFAARLGAYSTIDPVTGRPVFSQQDQEKAKLDLEKAQKDALKDYSQRRREAAAERRLTRLDQVTGAGLELDALRLRELPYTDETELGLKRTSAEEARAIAVARARRSEALSIYDYRTHGPYEEYLAKQDAALDEASRQATLDAGVKRAGLYRQRLDTSRARLGQVYSRTMQDREIIENLAAGPNSELAVAKKIHDEKIKYIKEEAALKEKTLENEQQTRDAMHQADMEYLQKLMQARQADVEKIAKTGGDLFDIMTTKSANKNKQIKDLIIGQVRGFGRTVFENVIRETLGMNGKGGGVLGSIQKVMGPLTTKKDGTPTWLGRVLGGTLLGPKADPAELQRKVTKENTDEVKSAKDQIKSSSSSLVEALNSLDDAVRSAAGLSGRTSSSMGQQTTSAPDVMGQVIKVLGLGDVSAAGTPAVSKFLGGGSSGLLSMPDLVSYAADTTASEAAKGSSPWPGAGKTWPGTSVPVGGSDRQAQMPSGSTTSTKSNLGRYIAGGAVAATGGLMAYQGFKSGNTLGGISGLLTAGAGIANMIPGGQLVGGLLGAGAGIMSLVSSLFKTSKERRGYDIANYLSSMKYVAPTKVDQTMSSAGNLVSYSLTGTARDTGINAFPITLSQERYGQTAKKTWGSPYVAEYYDIPGYQVYNNLPATSNNAQTPITINVPVQAMDAKSFLDRSPDIVAAVRKELLQSQDLGIALGNAIFGV